MRPSTDSSAGCSTEASMAKRGSASKHSASIFCPKQELRFGLPYLVRVQNLQALQASHEFLYLHLDSHRNGREVPPDRGMKNTHTVEMHEVVILTSICASRRLSHSQMQASTTCYQLWRQFATKMCDRKSPLQHGNANDQQYP